MSQIHITAHKVEGIPLQRCSRNDADCKGALYIVTSYNESGWDLMANYQCLSHVIMELSRLQERGANICRLVIN